MHFYKMSWREVERMPLSRFIKLFQAASMLESRASLTNLNIACFTSYSESDRKTFTRDLKHATTQYMERKLKSYQDVIGNIAKRMMKNGR